MAKLTPAQEKVIYRMKSGEKLYKKFPITGYKYLGWFLGEEKMRDSVVESLFKKGLLRYSDTLRGSGTRHVYVLTTLALAIENKKDA